MVEANEDDWYQPRHTRNILEHFPRNIVNAPVIIDKNVVGNIGDNSTWFTHGELRQVSLNL